mgnify:CR=1 FL=1
MWYSISCYRLSFLEQFCEWLPLEWTIENCYIIIKFSSSRLCRQSTQLFLCLFTYNGHILRSLICVNGSFSFLFRERKSFAWSINVFPFLLSISFTYLSWKHSFFFRSNRKLIRCKQSNIKCTCRRLFSNHYSKKEKCQGISVDVQIYSYLSFWSNP